MQKCFRPVNAFRDFRHENGESVNRRSFDLQAVRRNLFSLVEFSKVYGPEQRRLVSSSFLEFRLKVWNKRKTRTNHLAPLRRLQRVPADVVLDLPWSLLLRTPPTRP